MGQLLSLKTGHALLSFNTAGRFIEDHAIIHSRIQGMVPFYCYGVIPLNVMSP